MGQPVPLGQIEIAKQWNDVVQRQAGRRLQPGARSLDRARRRVLRDRGRRPRPTLTSTSRRARSWAAALGGSLLLGQLEIALAYQLRYQPSFTVAEADARVYQQVPTAPAAPSNDPDSCNPNYLGQPAPTVNGGTYAATSHLVSLAVVYRYAVRRRRKARRSHATHQPNVVRGHRRRRGPPAGAGVDGRAAPCPRSMRRIWRRVRTRRCTCCCKRRSSRSTSPMSTCASTSRPSPASPSWRGGQVVLLPTRRGAGVGGHRGPARRGADAVRAGRPAQPLDRGRARQPGAGP